MPIRFAIKTSLAILILLTSVNCLHASTIRRISVSDAGESGNGNSSYAKISDSGNYIVFESLASSLTPNDSNGFSDIFKYDNTSNTIQRITFGFDLSETNGGSWEPDISSDGNFIVFRSDASNIVPVDTNNLPDVFIYNNNTETIERVSVGFDGSEPNGRSERPRISSDGRYVAFNSYASNLVQGDTNGKMDIFIYNVETKEVERALGLNEAEPSTFAYLYSINADGRYIGFHAYTGNFVPEPPAVGYRAMVYDRALKKATNITVASDGSPAEIVAGRSSCSAYAPSLSADGRFVTFYAWNIANLINGGIITEGNNYVYIHDRDADEDGIYDEQSEDGSIFTDLVSMQYTQDYTPKISGNGKYVVASHAFMSEPYQVKLFKWKSAEYPNYEILSNWDTGRLPTISSDGRYVAFQSNGTNLVPTGNNGYEHIYISDRAEDIDRDGFNNFEECNDNDPAINPGATEICDGIDNNCDGQIDEGFDADNDGYTVCQGDLVDDDPTINPGATEICDGIDNNCDGQVDEGFDADNDGYTVCQGDLVDDDPAINPGATEICDGIDNNCDGQVDEGFDADNDGYTVCQECNDNDPTINPGATETKHDGIDQDCNGYDLTIDVTATYKANKDRLTVDATSSLGAAADLVLDGYGSMTYSGNKWSITIEPAGGNPGTVSITGIEGTETAAVQ